MTETKLYAKLAEVVDEIGYIAKTGHNKFQDYDYVTAETVLAEVRGPLVKRGVALMPSVTAISEREYQTSKGKSSVITTVHVRFTFVDAEDGGQHVCEWAGQGDDPADKGLGKAYTNAIKTFLREVLLIPQGDDPEADPQTDQRAADRQVSMGPQRASRNMSALQSTTPHDSDNDRTALRREIKVAADKAKMSSSLRANVILDATGHDAIEWENEAEANAMVVRAIEQKLSAKELKQVLEAIRATK